MTFVNYNKEIEQLASYNFADETTSTNLEGSAISNAQVNEPIAYGTEIIEAARINFFWLDSVNRRVLPAGHKDHIEYFEEVFEESAGITYDTRSDATAEIAKTVLSFTDGVTITPTPQTNLFSVPNYDLRKNKFNILEMAKEKLTRGLADKIDLKIMEAISAIAAPTVSAAGAFTLYGGDATSDLTLAAGDVMTPALITDSKRYLQEKTVYYRDSGVIKGTAVRKNAWRSSQDDPFVLYIGVAQEAELAKDSQFTHADVYGDREVILNGEIGRYHGVKIVVTPNIKGVLATGTAPDGGTAPVVDMTRCVLMKAKKAYTFVWGEEPRITVSPFERKEQTDIVLASAYEGAVVNSDATLHIDVSNE